MHLVVVYDKVYSIPYCTEDTRSRNCNRGLTYSYSSIRNSLWIDGRRLAQVSYSNGSSPLAYISLLVEAASRDRKQ